jgi:hypothetical protein
MATDALDQTKVGAEALALCIAQTLCERDPSLRTAMQTNTLSAYYALQNRGDDGAAEMLGAFGRALFDPSFPNLLQGN